MADWDASPEELVAYRDEWIEEYGIDWKNPIANDEMTQAQYAMLTKLDEKKLVWTEHGTCEDNNASPGFKIFGDCKLTGQESSGCGCYQSYSYYIAKEPWEQDYEYIAMTAYLPCSVCNPDGEGEGVEGCEGPKIPEGVDRSDCDMGFVNWYFD